MRKQLLSLAAISMFVTNIFATAPTATISGNITGTRHLVWDTIYVIDGFVRVMSGATIKIDEGTIIKGKYGNKSTLIIERGGTIDARGSKNRPIIMTSDRNPGSRDRGDWGGLVICGKATTNAKGVQAGVGLGEGGIGVLNSAEKLGYYGNGDLTAGTDYDADNSGFLQYVRVEFPGIPLASTANSEINGITLYGVGRGTTIDHVQVSYSGDDSYEWFGGSVNCKYLIAIRGLDDEYDTDNGYSGVVQFAVGMRDPNIADQSKSNGFETDNDADGSDLTPLTSAKFVNMSLFGPSTPVSTYAVGTATLFARAMHIRRNSRLNVYNSLLSGWPVGLAYDSQKGKTVSSLGTADGSVIKNSVMIDMGRVGAKNPEFFFNNADGVKSDSTAGANLWNTAGYGNTLYPATSSTGTLAINGKDSVKAKLKINDPYNLTAPNWTLKTGSPILTGAAFTDTKIANDAFVDKTVTFRGAFGTEDWTEGWASFNPQDEDYSIPGSQKFNVKVTEITITGTASISNYKGTTQLTAAVLPSNATDNTITWSISDGSSLATVSSTGIVTSLGIDGTVSVQAKANDNSGVVKTYTITITNQSLITGLSISGPDTITVDGGTAQMIVDVSPSNAAEKYTWSVINVAGKAKIDQTGLVTALSTSTSNGLVKVVIKANTSDVSDTFDITLSGQDGVDISLTGIAISGTNKIEDNGGTTQLAITATPADASDKSVTWSITSGDNLATITNNGLVTAKGNGTVTVKAIANDVSSGKIVDATYNVTITGQIVVSAKMVTINKMSAYPNPASGKVTFVSGNNISSIQLFTAQGQLVRIARYVDSKSVVFELEGLKSGIYIAKALDATGKPSVINLIIK